MASCYRSCPGQRMWKSRPPDPSPSSPYSLLLSAERKAEAACAILLDARCAPGDALPMLHAGWMRLLGTMAAIRGLQLDHSDLLRSTAGWELPGVPDSGREALLAELTRWSVIVAALPAADPSDLPPREALLRQAYQLRKGADVLRRQLNLREGRRHGLRPIHLVASSVALLLGIGVSAALLLNSGTREFGWRAEYFKVDDFKGESEVTREKEIAFFWNEGGAVPGHPVDRFSAVFDGCMPVDEAGSALFKLGSDDGARLFVDGKLVVDNGGRHSVEWKEGTVALEPGLHHLRIEYVEHISTASLTLKMGWNGEDPRVLESTRVLFPGLQPDSKAPCRALE